MHIAVFPRVCRSVCVILPPNLHFFLSDLCATQALRAQAHTWPDPLLLKTYNFTAAYTQVHEYTYILTAQAHLVSRMGLMNADLLAAGTGRLLVLMTGAFLGSQDENGERMQNRGSHHF